MPQPPRLPTRNELEEARRAIAGVAVRTPLARYGGAPPPGAAAEIHLKLETAQPIRSFKIRGAANVMAHAPAEALAGGVWTASAGNMAQGVAWCARERGIPCRVVVPDHAPRAKLDAIAALGGSIEAVPFDAWWRAMLTHAHPGMRGLMVHPFADTRVMAGNGTIGLELAADAPDLDAVLVPWGGGGLSLGIARALSFVSPRTRVYAVEVETAAPLTASLAAGRPVTVSRTATWIDGMGSDRVAADMWPLAAGLI
ncbi:MAG TPA: pyridoxal-phosphate dependent enzyme, partial [Gemmatimonadaceae bacterium]|nr:pyridoxal-phosphate dependent enzyme [Gemmatimonadaceae bacterium]